MKVFFITREGYRLPGARVRCYNFARELARYKIDTEVLSFSDTLGASDGAEEAGMGIFERTRQNLRALKILLRRKNSIFIIQRFNYHSFAPFLAGLTQNNRIVLDLDDWEMREEPKYHFGFYPSSKAHYLTKLIARKSIFCIAASRFLEDFLRKCNNSVHYVPSGVDTECFMPLSKGEKQGIVFSWIGTLHKKEYVENIKFAMDCFSLLRRKYENIYFDIAADGIHRGILLETIDNFKDPHVRFRGWIEPRDVPGYLNGVDIGLFPVARNNKFNLAKSPTKVFEYMAMEKAVVASSIGEASHIIKDGYNGLLAGTRDEFAVKMEVLLENPELCMNIGKQARKVVLENYSLHVLGKRLEEALCSI